jgi:lysophospholipase L1-like esterase
LNPQLRRAALRLLLLAALVFTGDRLLARAGTSLLLDSELRFSVAVRGGLPPLVLVLGDSRAVNGFWTPELARVSGEPAFNLAYNGMSTRIAEALLRDTLAANAPPRMIVLEVSNVQDRHALSSALAGYWPVSPHLAALGRELTPRNADAARVSHLFALNGEIFLRALRYHRRSDQDAVNRFRTTPEILAAARALAPFELKAHADNLDALGRIVALADERRIPLRLVVAPYLPQYVAHASNWDDWIGTIARAAGPDARIWDYGRSDPDPAHFADRLHLNADGAVPFLEQLGRDGFFAFDTPGPAQ